MKQGFLLFGSIAILMLTGCATLSNKQTTVTTTVSGNQTTTPSSEQEAPKSPVAKSEQESPEKPAPKVVIQKFAPTYKSTEEDIYDDATEIYDSSPSAAQGVYSYQGLVFVIVVIDTNKEKILFLEETALLRAKVLLKRKFPLLPASFVLDNRQMENDLDDDTGIYRYAVVFRQSDIMKLLEKVKQQN